MKGEKLIFFSSRSLRQLNHLTNLGLLGIIAQNSCLIEPFRNPCTEIEIRSCLSKLYSIGENILRQAKRQKTALVTVKLPDLWILTPTCSQKILKNFGATQKDEQGIYFLPPSLQTGIIVIHQLAVREDTLWLRVLGRGKVQKRAIQELIELPTTNPLRDNLLEILADWRQNLELRDNVTKEDEEVMMNLSPAYVKQKEEWRQEALLEGKLELIESLLKVRFQNLDEELKSIIPLMLQLPTEKLTPLLLTLNREELLLRFKSELN